jgi:hypothetical protein
MTPDEAGTAGRARLSREQLVALLFGTVFLLVGVAGFIPGLTQHSGDLDFLGHGSGAKLLGLFQVSILHNVVHLLFGFAGLALYRTAKEARAYLVGGGVLYLVVWLYGVLVSHGSSANFVPVNRADNYLHLGLGIAMVGLGVLFTRADPQPS